MFTSLWWLPQPSNTHGISLQYLCWEVDMHWSWVTSNTGGYYVYVNQCGWHNNFNPILQNFYLAWDSNLNSKFNDTNHFFTRPICHFIPLIPNKKLRILCSEFHYEVTNVILPLLSVKVSCDRVNMFVAYRSSGFQGRLFALGHSDYCGVIGTSHSLTTLVLPLPGSDPNQYNQCGVIQARSNSDR